MFSMRHQHIFGQFPNTQNIRNEEQPLISHPLSILLSRYYNNMQ